MNQIRIEEIQQEYGGTVQVFDVITSYDNHEIYWLHDEVDNTKINPDDLYVDEHVFEDDCRELYLAGIEIKNYVFEDELLEEWEKEKRDLEELWS